MGGTVSAILGAALINHLPDPFTCRVWEWPIPGVAGFLLGLVLITALLHAADYRICHFLRLEAMPAPVAGVIGSGVFVGLVDARVADGVFAAAIAIILLFMGLLFRLWLSVLTRLPKSRSEGAFKERPIETAEQDRFRYTARARRLAARLRAGGGPILVIGRYGSGKSSLTNLVFEELEQGDKIVPGTHSPHEHRMRRKEKWLKIRVSGWGIQEPEARARTIVSEVCEKMNDYIDTLPLRGYCSRTIEELFGEMHWSTRLAYSFSRPAIEELSRHMDSLLEIGGMRALLVVDDFERNAEKGGKYRWHAGVSELLEHLKHARHLKLIVCVTKEAIQ